MIDTRLWDPIPHDFEPPDYMIEEHVDSGLGHREVEAGLPRVCGYIAY